MGYNDVVNDAYLIADVFTLDLTWDEARLVFQREDDHLLRRFGQAEVRGIKQRDATPFTYREAADEIWAVIQGRANFTLFDLREKSPSEGQTVKLTLDESSPQALLVPFGVAFAIQAEADSQFIRLTTHLDNAHPEDKTIPFEELLKQP